MGWCWMKGRASCFGVTTILTLPRSRPPQGDRGHRGPSASLHTSPMQKTTALQKDSFA